MVGRMRRAEFGGRSGFSGVLIPVTWGEQREPIPSRSRVSRRKLLTLGQGSDRMPCVVRSTMRSAVRPQDVATNRRCVAKVGGIPCGGPEAMAITYFKRFRMEYDLRALMRRPPLTPGYRLLPWSAELLDAHADTKFRCFRYELDANVFPCLGDRDGCLRLMQEIARRPGFIEGATWLLQAEDDAEYCGTIQGIVDLEGYGSIQNLGVTQRHRGRGLGSILLFQALAGFRDAGLRRAFLEVTAQNIGAVRLYQRLGFRKVKTLYKASELACV